MSEDSPAYRLQEASLNALNTIKDEVDGLFQRYGTDSSPTTSTLKKLFWYLSSRSQTVSFLASWGYAWDAEIILRSFYETAAKILFICFADDAEKEGLVDEYWNRLGSIADRRTARKAAFAQQVFDPSDVSSSVFALLQDEQLFDLEAEGSKTERKRLERKWSFSEIIEELHKRPVKGKALAGIKSLLHIYGVASHLAHADQAAMDLMTDRALRPADERRILEAGHLSRILTDQVSISWLCADALRIHFGGRYSDAEKMRTAFDEPIRLSKPLQSEFDDSQRQFYARWLGDA